MSIIICIIGLAGMILFLIPVKTGKIWNIGNQTGFFAGLILFLGGMIIKRKPEILGSLWDEKVCRYIICGIAGILAVLLLLILLETVCIVKATIRKPEKDAVVVILGCKIYGENASLTLISRLEAAARYLKKYPQSRCIVSGGQGSDEPISEAECMYRYLIRQGISPSRIIKEDKSTSTRENLTYSLEILCSKEQKDGWEKRKIAIATSEFHQYRASRIADSLGIRHGAISAATPWWLLPTFYVRELYGILYEWIRKK